MDVAQPDSKIKTRTHAATRRPVSFGLLQFAASQGGKDTTRARSRAQYTPRTQRTMHALLGPGPLPSKSTLSFINPAPALVGICRRKPDFSCRVPCKRFSVVRSSIFTCYVES